MITEMKIDLSQKTCVEWAGHVKAFEDRASIIFEPGLNVLWAPNGYGKTSVLLALARSLFCAQGGIQKITWEGLVQTGHRESDGGFRGLLPIHDGAPVMYCDPSTAADMNDTAFGFEGFKDLMAHGSSGETTYRRLSDALNAIYSGKFPKVEAQMASPMGGRSSASADDPVVCGLLADLVGDGQMPTVLLDEPDRSLDVPMQAQLWMGLHGLREKAQMIVSSHSICALGWPSVNYIDLKSGYLGRSLEAASAMFEGVVHQYKQVERA